MPLFVLLFVLSGLSNEENVEKMKNLSSSRANELNQCLRSTYCFRQSWIENQRPTISSILDAYPKFCMVPELVCCFLLFVALKFIT